jgi:hypothetical protein
MNSILVEQGVRLPRSPWDIIAVVGNAAKGDGNPTLITSLTSAIAKYGERLSLSTASGKGLESYGLVDAIETIFKYVQVPIIAVNSTPSVAVAAVAAKNYTFNASGIIKLEHPNIVAPIIVTNVAADITYVSPTHFTIAPITGIITRTAASTIPALGTVRVTYSVANYDTIDSISAIGLVAAVGGREPTLIVTAGVEITAEIAIALNNKAIALGAIAVYTQPGISATAAIPLLTSANAAAVFPIRTSDRGVEGAGVHLVAAVALLDYWENPNGKSLKESAIAITLADSALLQAKGITWGSDRIMTSIMTNGLPFNIARLRAKAQSLADRVAFDWRQKPFDLVHLEAIAQAIRDALNREPEASLLPYGVVNFSSEKSDTADRRLVYDVLLKGDNQADRIAEITIFVS